MGKYEDLAPTIAASGVTEQEARDAAALPEAAAIPEPEDVVVGKAVMRELLLYFRCHGISAPAINGKLYGSKSLDEVSGATKVPLHQVKRLFEEFKAVRADTFAAAEPKPIEPKPEPDPIIGDVGGVDEGVIP